jgi:site-specific DNA-methyltransferase (adenine-specific)
LNVPSVVVMMYKKDILPSTVAIVMKNLVEWNRMETNKVYLGNCAELLKDRVKFPEQSIATIVTSPPYWQKRDYGAEAVNWGGKADCQHEWEEKVVKGIKGGHNSPKQQIKGEVNFQETEDQIVNTCKKCGMMNCNLGWEPHPDQYVSHLCDIFDTCWDLLANYGSLWVNLGDTYNGNKKGNQRPGYEKAQNSSINKKLIKGTSNKSKLSIPARFQLEMENRGWCLRQIIIWAKPNPMPDSSCDRFIDDFEFFFWFVKDEDAYWFKEQRPRAQDQKPGKPCYGGIKLAKEMEGIYSGNEYKPIVQSGEVTANMRTTWWIPISNFRGSHPAVFPEQLVEVPIDATCPDRICSKCGEPLWYERKSDSVATRPSIDQKEFPNMEKGRTVPINDTWIIHTCICGANYVPGIVLDPFFGRGTVGKVALRQGKAYLGTEIVEDNVKEAEAFIKTEFPNGGNKNDHNEV